MTTNRPRNRNQQQEPAATPKKGMLNNMEMLGIGLFFFAICLYGISQCGKEDLPPSNPTVQEVAVDSTNTTASNEYLPTTPNNENTGSTFSTGENPARPRSTTVTTPTNQKLYVIIDSLKMRKGPRLDSALVAYLRYGEAVIDLGERTVLEKIRISVDEVRTAPWVKVKNSKGKVGWAFGAGLQFYPVATQTNAPE